MFWAKSSQCNSLLLNRVVGQVDVLVGQVNFEGSLAHLASNVLEPMLLPWIYAALWKAVYGDIATKN